MGEDTIIHLAQASAERAAAPSQQVPADPTASLQAFEAWFVARAHSNECGDTLPQGKPGEALGRFRVIRRLGSGGFGIVFLAFDPLLQREVALKLPRPQLLLVPNWTERVLHEARIAATLDHPAIVPVHEVGEIGPVWYIASTYCDGHSLAEYLANQSERLPIAAATELIALVADGLQHAHSRGVLHRDLKAANILLTAPRADKASTAADFIGRCNPRLTDFGLAARSQDFPYVDLPRIAGTPAYMPPELAEAGNAEHSIQSDIYSLGAVLFELLTGRPPFVAESSTAILSLVKNEAPPTARSLRRTVHPDLDAIVAKCLSRCPADRYLTAEQFASDLREHLAGRPVSARPLGAVARSLRWCRNRPVMAALAALLLACTLTGVSGIAWQWRRAEQNLAIAERERGNAERHLAQAEQVLLELGAAIDDSAFLRDRLGAARHPQIETAAKLYMSILNDPHQRGQSLPLLALANGQLGRHSELNHNPQAAKDHYLSSIEQWWELRIQSPENDAYRRGLAQSCYWYGRFLVTNEHRPDGQSHIYLNRLMAVVPLDQPLGIDVALSYADLLFTKAEDLSKTEAWAQAIDEFAACRAVGSAALSRHSNNLPLAMMFARSSFRLAQVTRASGNRQHGYTLLNQAFVEIRPMVTQHPHHLGLVSTWGEICRDATAKRAGLTERERSELLREAIQATDQALSHAEIVERTHLRLAVQLNHNFADSQSAQHAEPSVILSSTLRACDYCDRLLKASSSQPRDASMAAGIYLAAAKLFQAEMNSEESLKFAGKAASAFDASEEDTKQRKHTVLSHSECYLLRAQLLREAGRNREATEAINAGISVLEKWGGSRPDDDSVARFTKKFHDQLRLLTSSDEVVTP